MAIKHKILVYSVVGRAEFEVEAEDINQAQIEALRQASSQALDGTKKLLAIPFSTAEFDPVRRECAGGEYIDTIDREND